MPEVSITIKNLPQIRAAFGAAPGIMGRRFREALQKSVLLIQRKSMINTPVDTGRLRASHTSNIEGFGVQMKATVGPDVNYAIYVHEGTRYVQARPFLRDAADDALNDIDGFFTRATQDALDEIGKMV